MELAQILKTLIDRKLAVAAVVALAVLAALATLYHVSPSGLQKRSYEYGAAQVQMLIDSPRSQLIDLSQETPPLSIRAAVYAQFMRSNGVKQEISRVTGVPADAIVAQAPTTTESGTQNLPRAEAARANEVRQAGDQYRLLFDYQPDLPIVSIYAQAPDARAAAKLADGAVAGVRAYVAQLEARDRVAPKDQTQIRELGPAEGGTVNAGVNPIMALMAFLGVLVAGCGTILGVVALRTGLRRLAMEARAAEVAAAVVTLPANGAARDAGEQAEAVTASAPQNGAGERAGWRGLRRRER
jgi:hypothetical protein